MDDKILIYIVVAHGYVVLVVCGRDPLVTAQIVGFEREIGGRISR